MLNSEEKSLSWKFYGQISGMLQKFKYEFYTVYKHALNIDNTQHSQIIAEIRGIYILYWYNIIKT